MDTANTVTLQGQLLHLVADQLRSELIWCNGSWWSRRYRPTGIVWRPYSSAELQPIILAAAIETAINQDPGDGEIVTVAEKLARGYRYQAFERQLRPLLAGTELPVTQIPEP